MDRSDHSLEAAHVEKSFLLARERRIRKILRGRGGTHGDGDVRTGCKCSPGSGYLIAQSSRQGRLADPSADLRTGSRELGDIVDVQTLEAGSDPCIEPAVGEELAVGLGGGREAIRNPHMRCRKPPDHLAERGVLAAYTGDIAHAQCVQRQYPSIHDHCLRVPFVAHGNRALWQNPLQPLQEISR